MLKITAKAYEKIHLKFVVTRNLQRAKIKLFMIDGVVYKELNIYIHRNLNCRLDLDDANGRVMFHQPCPNFSQIY